MKLPKKLKIGYKIYQVVEMTNEQRHHGKVGMCCHNTSTISINTQAGDEMETLNTLLHEIMHACYFMADLSKGCGEETVVLGLTNSLLQVLNDNKIEGINYKKST